MSVAEPPPFRWRSVIAAAVLPTTLFSIGEGAIVPIIPVVADDLGASLALAGLIAAMLTVGGLLGDLPSGPLIARVGERTAMIGAAGVSALGLVLAALAPNAIVLGAGILLIGVAATVFALARHAFMTSFVPVQYRARALSTLGGTFRFGFFVGPFLTAGLIQLTGTAASAFWVGVACSAGAALLLVLLRDPETIFQAQARHSAALSDGEREAERETLGLFGTLRANAGLLGTLGVASALVAALRSSRMVIVPLWAVSIGMHESTAAVVIGIAGAVDFALFYLGGVIMDRFGRLWTALPSMVGLAAGHLLLSVTHDVSANATWFVVVAMALALANGIGAGILMTLGADLADPRDPAPFLGAWRFCNDTGGAAAPLLIAGITAIASLSVAAAGLGALGLIGAVLLRIFVPRYSSRR